MSGPHDHAAPVYEGGCLCAGVAYAFTEPRQAFHCHCLQCRKAHAAAFASYVRVPVDAFAWTRGEALVTVFESSPGVWRHFCSRCSSALLWQNSRELPEFVSVSLGTLDTPLPPMEFETRFAERRASWCPHD